MHVKERILEAEKFTREQEAAGIAAVGTAEAETIRAKELAEAMKKYEEAAVFEILTVRASWCLWYQDAGRKQSCGCTR